MNRLLFALGFALLTLHAGAADVLGSGNSIGTGHEAFDANLIQVNHTFTFVSADALASTELTGFNVVWLDGFSSFSEIPSAALIAFMEAGGRVIVQNPGFGGNPLESYPFGAELSAAYDPDSQLGVSTTQPSHRLNQGLSSELLTGWLPASTVGYFTEAGSFLGITDTGVSGQWVTLVRQVGAGELIYTHQALSSVLQAGVLTLDSGPMVFLQNLLADFEPVTATAPTFLKSSDFWLGADGLHGFLPDPNSDGLDPDGAALLGYEWSIVSNGVVTVGPTPVVATTWPADFLVPSADLPSGSYHINFARTALGSPTSDPVVLNGPSQQATDPGVLRRYQRWLLHAPRRAGGFSGVVRIDNPLPQSSAQVRLIAFGANGAELASDTVTVAAASKLDRVLYDDVFTDPALLDLVSHIAVWEPTGVTEASIRYIADVSGFGVWAKEVNTARDRTSGTLFRMDGATPSTEYYDGVALVNLSSAVTPRLMVRRFGVGGEPAGILDLGSLAPGSKVLSALSFAFPTFLENASYEIEAVSDNSAAQIQVFGLSGSTSKTFFATANVSKRR